MLKSLPRLQEVVMSHLKSCQDLTDAEVTMDSENTQRVYLEEAREDPEHPLYTLPQRYGHIIHCLKGMGTLYTATKVWEHCTLPQRYGNIVHCHKGMGTLYSASKVWRHYPLHHE